MIQQGGTYIAKAIGGSFGNSSQKGTPGVAITFQVKDSTDRVTWIGWMSEKTIERTMDTVAMLGFREDLDVKDNKFGPEHLADKEVEIVVEMEPSQKDPMKSYPKVAWVNELGGAKFGGLSSTGNAVPKNLKAMLAAARARTGQKAPTSTAPMMQESITADGDLPF